jgi:hypothetical protein
VTLLDLDDLLPTDADVASYREHGWYVSRKILGDDILDAAIEASERFYAGEIPVRDDVIEIFHPRLPTPPGLRKHDYASLSVPELFAIVSAPAIGAIAARLTGADGIRLWHDQLLYKPPLADGDPPGNVGWHTDRSYWKAATSEDMLTAWVPFHTVSMEHGPLMMIDGSNRWGREHTGKPDFFRQDIEVQEQEITEQSGRTIEKVPLLLERGQVSFHDCRTFHGSGPNRSGEARRSIAVHMQPADNRPSGAVGSDGVPVHHYNIDHVRRTADGTPDFADPVFCPQLYPATIPPSMTSSEPVMNAASSLAR